MVRRIFILNKILLHSKVGEHGTQDGSSWLHRHEVEERQDFVKPNKTHQWMYPKETGIGSSYICRENSPWDSNLVFQVDLGNSGIG